MSWINAYMRGLLIVAFFVLATVTIPNYVIKWSTVADASRWVRDGIVLGFWGGGLVAGLWLLRLLQRRGVI